MSQETKCKSVTDAAAKLQDRFGWNQHERAAVEQEMAAAFEMGLQAYSVWGTDICGSCQGGRVTLYYRPPGTCIECRNKRQEKSDVSEE